MDPEERRMLKELSDADGQPEAAVVRQLVRQAHGARFGAHKGGRRAPK
jgi:hypothetical protein